MASSAFSVMDGASGGGGAGNVIVVCRFRPLNKKELQMQNAICADFHPDGKTVTVKC